MAARITDTTRVTYRSSRNEVISFYGHQQSQYVAHGFGETRADRRRENAALKRIIESGGQDAAPISGWTVEVH